MYRGNFEYPLMKKRASNVFKKYFLIKKHEAVSFIPDKRALLFLITNLTYLLAHVSVT